MTLTSHNVMMGCHDYVWECLSVMRPDILQLKKISLLWVLHERIMRHWKDKKQQHTVFSVCLITMKIVLVSLVSLD